VKGCFEAIVKDAENAANFGNGGNENPSMDQILTARTIPHRKKPVGTVNVLSFENPPPHFPVQYIERMLRENCLVSPVDRNTLAEWLL
jgi:hypothetical protein